MKVITPLAQTFYVEQKSGIFVTSLDLYFHGVDVNSPVTVQLRPVKGGKPSRKVYPFSEVTLDPKNIVGSLDASIPTRFTFDSPVYLKGKTFHSIVLITNSEINSVWTSKLGEIDVFLSGEGEANQVIVSKQPLSGGLFKSQNGGNWIEEPYEDLTFNLYRQTLRLSPVIFLFIIQN
jgi:hypothetical protein